MTEDHRPIVDVYVLSCGTVATALHEWTMRIALTERRYQIRLHGSYDQPVANNRNQIVRRFLQADGDYLMMIDEDQAAGFNPMDFVAADKDIVGFPTPVWRTGHTTPDDPIRWNVWIDDEEGRPTGGAMKQGDRLVEVGGVGSGLILIARRVLAHPEMQAPFMDEWDEDGCRTASEDRTFCIRARKAGFKVWCAPHHTCGHFKTVDLVKVVTALDLARKQATGRYVTPMDAFRGKRLIFSLSPGRCGTAWLARALAALEDVDAHHEPHPEFRFIMRPAQYDPATALQFWLEKKLPVISSTPASTYVETSHLFGQGFARPLLQIGIVPDLIVIRRPHREVAVSMWKRGAIPGRVKALDPYHLQPDDQSILVKPTGDWHEWTDYQVCYWHGLEIEARVAQLVPLFRSRGSTVAETRMSEMVTRQGIDRLCETLGLERVPELPGVVNANPPHVEQRKPPEDVDAQEADLARRVQGHDQGVRRRAKVAA